MHVFLRKYHILLAVFLLTAACNPPVSRPEPTAGKALRIDGANVLAIAREMVNIGPRPSGSEGAAKTAEWIVEKLERQGFPAKIQAWREETPRGKMTFRNVIMTSPGKKAGRIILGSHYDTKRLPQYPHFIGANDSGSSTALLLALIPKLAKLPPDERCTLEFVFFDGEECVEEYSDNDGLHGSRYYARLIDNRKEIKEYRAMILPDMIGDRDLHITIPRETPRHLAQTLFAVAEDQNVRHHIGYLLRGSIIDDHVPFARLGIPSINLIDFEYGPDNRYWHTPEDTLDKLSAASLETVGNVVAEMTRRLALQVKN